MSSAQPLKWLPMLLFTPDDKIKHECIPVGCELSVAVAILGVGVVYPGGVCQKGAGVCQEGG